MVGAMAERLNRWLDRLESRLALFGAIGGPSAVGLIASWLATYSDWVSQFGAIGWLFAGLIACLLTALVGLAAARIRLAWVRASVTRRWQETVDAFNPLDSHFHRVRVRVSDLADPVTNSVEGKRFTECDILGPASVVLSGSAEIFSIDFRNCDFVPHDEKVVIYNAIRLVDCSFSHSRLAKITIYVPIRFLKDFEQMGAQFVSPVKGEAPEL